MKETFIDKIKNKLSDETKALVGETYTSLVLIFCGFAVAGYIASKIETPFPTETVDKYYKHVKEISEVSNTVVLYKSKAYYVNSAELADYYYNGRNDGIVLYSNNSFVTVYNINDIYIVGEYASNDSLDKVMHTLGR